MATDRPGVSRTLRERLERATVGRYRVTRCGPASVRRWARPPHPCEADQRC